MKHNSNHEDWFVKFVNKHQPIDSEDINVLLELIGCAHYTNQLIDEEPSTAQDVVTEVDNYQNEFFQKVKEFLIITGRN